MMAGMGQALAHLNQRIDSLQPLPLPQRQPAESTPYRGVARPVSHMQNVMGLVSAINPVDTLSWLTAARRVVASNWLVDEMAAEIMLELARIAPAQRVSTDAATAAPRRRPRYAKRASAPLNNAEGPLHKQQSTIYASDPAAHYASDARDQFP